jgi:asparagine synthase (glutamine-hydrolysing)
MCGICADTRDPDGAALRRMLPCMVHRGPDDEGAYVDPASGVGLGARRLSILDIAGGHQPIANEDGTIWAVLNGEIYNYPELRARLLARGHDLDTTCDTEVLVHLYEDLGEDLAVALDGMYAFVIWDSRRGRLISARDRFGEKPFFYCASDGRLTIASELTTLLAGRQRDVQPAPEAVDAYYVFGYVPGPDSIDCNVRQLGPGQVLLWDHASASLHIRTYYTPPVFNASPIDAFDTVAEAREVLERSVSDRLLADVPVGIFLSGGVDSTLVAALAARASSERIRTFTVGYDTGDVNETGPARLTAEALGSEHHEVIIGQDELLDRVPSLLGRLDQPLADQALVALNALAERAKDVITVALGGEGADEFFAGYPRYQWLARAEQFRHVVPPRTAQRISSVIARTSGTRVAQRLADVTRPTTTLDRHLDWVTGGRRHMRERVYGPALRREGLVSRSADELLSNPQPAGATVYMAFMHLDQTHWLVDDVLAKADRATMLASLEMRTPFLSRELAALAAGVPLSVHLRGKGKHVLREVLRGLDMPQEPGRPKQAFRVPVADWLRGPLRGHLDEQLAHSAAYEEGWFDRAGVRTVIEEHAAGRADHSGMLWPIFAFSCWLDDRRGGL